MCTVQVVRGLVHAQNSTAAARRAGKADRPWQGDPLSSTPGGGPAPRLRAAAPPRAVLVSRVAVCAGASGAVQHYPVPGLVPTRGGGQEAVVMHVYQEPAGGRDSPPPGFHVCRQPGARLVLPAGRLRLPAGRPPRGVAWRAAEVVSPRTGTFPAAKPEGCRRAR